MITALYQLVSATPEVRLALPDIDFNEVNLGPTRMQAALQASLPLIVGSLTRTDNLSERVTNGIKTLADALLFLVSETHENDRIERMRGNEIFRSVLREEIEAMKDEEGGSIIPTDPSRKLRNTLLEAWSF